MDKVKIDSRGRFSLKLGGKVRNFRYRTHELTMLERKSGVGIFEFLKPENIGLSTLRDAITVGVAHEFVGKRGKLKEALTDEVVSEWIDNCEERDGVPFDVLLETVISGILSGLPGGGKLVADDGEEDDEGNDESADQ